MPPHLLKPKGPVLPLRSAAATSSRYPSRNITSLAPAALSSAETEAAVAEAAVAVAAATPIGPGSVLLIHGELASGLKLEQGLILSEVIENGLQRMQNESYKVELRQNPFTSLMGVHLPPEMCQDLAGLYLQGCQRQDDGMLLLILGRRKKRMTLAQCLVSLATSRMVRGCNPIHVEQELGMTRLVTNPQDTPFSMKAGK